MDSVRAEIRAGDERLTAKDERNQYHHNCCASYQAAPPEAAHAQYRR
jgi:hypothetical protein